MAKTPIQQLTTSEQWDLANAVAHHKKYGTNVPNSAYLGIPGLADFCADTGAHKNIPKEWLDKIDPTSFVKNANRNLCKEGYLIKEKGGGHSIAPLSAEQLAYLEIVLHKYD